MRQPFILISIVASLVISPIFGQIPGEHLFDNTVIHEIRFDSNYPSLVDTLTEHYVLSFGIGQIQIRKIPYSPASVTIDGTTLADSAGVRYKGFNSWWSADKKPIKVDLNKYADQAYDGLTKFNLHNGAGDPAFIRENISYSMLRSIGIKAPRTAYAKVYLDNDYLGLYRIVEQVDNTFLDVNFGGHEGNLYVQQSNGSGGYVFDWISHDQEDYYQHLELENHQKTNDWSSLIHFFDVLNHAPDQNFKNEIEAVFDVDAYLQILAFDIAINNIDYYGNAGRNYYLAEVNGKFHWIPWDYNLSWREGEVPIDINPDDYPLLMKRILKVPAFYNSFLGKYCALLPYLSHATFDELVDQESAKIDALMKIDPVMDYPYEAFTTNLSARWGDIPGLKQFAAARYAEIIDTFGSLHFDCSVTDVEGESQSHIEVYPVPTKDFLYVKSVPDRAIVTILNSLGQVVSNVKVDEQHAIDVRKLPAGYYLLKVQTANSMYSKGVVVE